MPKHLGRNPFDKKKSKPQAGSRTHRSGDAIEKVPHEKAPQKGWSKFSDWAMIQVPAQSVVFALKAALRLKDLIERD